MNKKIGFIGLGIMGIPMAKNILSKNSELICYDISKEALDKVSKLGATVADTASALAKDCEIIFIIVPDVPHVQSIIFGENGISKTAKKGTIIVDMSSIPPTASIEIANKCKEHDLLFLDAPVSGGEPKAVDGTLSFMVGGSKEAFDAVTPYFNMMGSSAVLIGDSGAGSATKLANQIIVNLNIAALSEAMILIAKMGIDPQKVVSAISGGLAASAVLNAKAPMMINRDFKAGGRIDINKKDIRNVLATSHHLGLSLPLTAQLYEEFQSLSALDKNTLDHSAILNFYENINNVKLEKK